MNVTVVQSWIWEIIIFPQRARILIQFEDIRWSILPSVQKRRHSPVYNVARWTIVNVFGASISWTVYRVSFWRSLLKIFVPTKTISRSAISLQRKWYNQSHQLDDGGEVDFRYAAVDQLLKGDRPPGHWSHLRFHVIHHPSAYHHILPR